MGRGSPVACACTFCAEYSSNWSRESGKRISIVFTVNPPRKTHFFIGCQATPRRGWKLLLSRLLSALEGWTIAPVNPVSESFPAGSKLLINPYLVLNGLSFEYRTPMLRVRVGVSFQSSWK